MTEGVEARPTDEQVMTAQEYLGIRNRLVVAQCGRCRVPSQLNLGFAEQFAAGRFLTAVDMELEEPLQNNLVADYAAMIIQAAATESSNTDNSAAALMRV